MCIDCGPLLDAIERYILKADEDLESQLEDEGYEHSKETVESISDIEEQIASALQDETDEFLDAIKGAMTMEAFAKEVWPKVKDSDNLADALREIFDKQFSSLVPKYADYYINRADPALHVDEVSERTLAWIKTWSQQLGDIMKLNSHEEIERLLTASLEKGITVQEFAKSILDSGIRDEYYKARRAAITEVLRAHSVAQHEAMMQNAGCKEKEWVHTGAHKNKPRKNHQAMNGQRVAKDAPFELEGIKGGTYHPMYPRDTSLPPEESINCHCLAREVPDPAILGLSPEERKKLQQEALAQMNDDWEKERDEQNKAKAGIA